MSENFDTRREIREIKNEICQIKLWIDALQKMAWGAEDEPSFRDDLLNGLKLKYVPDLPYGRVSNAKRVAIDANDV